MTQQTTLSLLISTLQLAPGSTAAELSKATGVDFVDVSNELTRLADTGQVVRERERGYPYRYSLAPAVPEEIADVGALQAQLVEARAEIARLKQSRAAMATMLAAVLPPNLKERYVVAPEGKALEKAGSFIAARRRAEKAARAGSRRARVFLLVPVGEARQGAEWKEA